MIEFAKESDFDTLKNLWKTCFPLDTDQFVDFYFQQQYRQECTIVFRENNRLTAALQMLPYKMSFCGGEVNVVYISGAATFPQFQNQGMMAALLKHSFQLNAQNQVAASVLIPQEGNLVNYYSKFGYQPFFEQNSQCLSIVARESNHLEEITLDNIEQAYRFFVEKWKNYDCRILKSLSQLKIVLAEYQLSGGQLLAWKQQEKIFAAAFCYPCQETVYVKDLQAEKDYQKPFLEAIAKHYQSENIHLTSQASQQEAHEARGMLKIINIEAFWPYVQKDQRAIVLQMPENEQVKYLLSLCKYLPFMTLMLD
ncbi:MAG: GNAT family N-acetyltransferase [Bacteroidales bacterium]|nr:GNAT family N-acetyltransferase [Bacteroidales bacterium]